MFIVNIIKTPERCHFTYCSSVSFVNFENVIGYWETGSHKLALLVCFGEVRLFLSETATHICSTEFLL